MEIHLNPHISVRAGCCKVRIHAMDDVKGLVHYKLSRKSVEKS